MLTAYAAANGGAAPSSDDGWPTNQLLLSDIHPISIVSFGTEIALTVSCKPTPGVATPVGYPYAPAPLPCRTVPQAFVWPELTACILAWGGALVLALAAGLVLKRARTAGAAVGFVDGSSIGTTTTSNSVELATAAAAAKLAMEGGGGVLDTVRLHSSKLGNDYGDCGGGLDALVPIAGRPDVAAFLAAAAAVDASTADAASAALDVYVCGSAGLLADASDAFYKAVAPVRRGSAFLGLHYSIG